MRVIAMIIASIMAIITMVYHLLAGSSLLIMLLRVSITWVGFAALILLTEFALGKVFQSGLEREEEIFRERKRLEIASRYDEDEFFK